MAAGGRHVRHDRRLHLERGRRYDLPGRRSRRNGRRGHRGRLGHAAGECLLQQRRHVLRALVLQVIDVEAHAFAAAAVEALDPFARLLDVFLVRRNDEQRVHPLDRNDAQDARERARVAVADQLVEFLRDRLDVGVLQREHAGGHARHPVDVEHVDRFHQVPQLRLGARKDQQVAHVVAANRLRILRERLENAQHVAYADILERNDLDRIAGRQRPRGIAQLGRHVAAYRRGLRHHLPHLALVHHRRAVHPQQRLERRGERLARYPGRRANRHTAADVRVDRVRLIENVAQDVAHDFAQIGGFEVQDDRTARGRGRRARRERSTRLLSANDDPGPFVDA